MSKIEELVAATKIGEFIGKKKKEDEEKNNLFWIIAIIASVLAVAGIGFALYKYFSAKKYDEFDGFEDEDFDDDFFEDDFSE